MSQINIRKNDASKWQYTKWCVKMTVYKMINQNDNIRNDESKWH